MFCPYCGKQTADNAVFCTNCGRAIPAPSTPASSWETNSQQSVPNYAQPNPNYQQSAPNYQQSAPNYQQPYPNYQPQNAYTPLQEKPLSMSWFKFLIYFALWAGALLNVANGMMMLNGMVYGSEKDAKLVYALFEDMKSLDMICGVFLIILAVFGIFTRFQLAGFKKNGPMCVTLLYVGVIVFDLAYIIGACSILPEKVVEAMDFTSTGSSIAFSAAMMVYNISYFKQRAHLFVK